ncbi:MAG TPA: hypothetical protein VFM30_02670 [Steroidobacteraceae bacterium]|jgi:hypothetical protein|nr:hypothetical protein [Steroidobacteraceae bacterium]
MGKASAAPVAVYTLLAAATSGCAATGDPYPEVLARLQPLPEGRGRVVVLRSDDDANRNYISPVYVRIRKDLAGELAYGGFLIAEVPAGDVALQASGDGSSHDACHLELSVASGETRYVGVDPRREYMAADIFGTLVSVAVRASFPSTVGIGDLPETLVVEPLVAEAAGAAATTAASAAEGKGKTCAGPYRLTPLSEAAALAELPRLKSSH